MTVRGHLARFMVGVGVFAPFVVYAAAMYYVPGRTLIVTVLVVSAALAWGVGDTLLTPVSSSPTSPTSPTPASPPTSPAPPAPPAPCPKCGGESIAFRTAPKRGCTQCAYVWRPSASNTNTNTNTTTDDHDPDVTRDDLAGEWTIGDPDMEDSE